MKAVYPTVFFESEKNGYAIYIPDFNHWIQAPDFYEGMIEARKAIGILGQDYGKEIPLPQNDPIELKNGEKLVYIDVDFDEYKKADRKIPATEKRTIPSWLLDYALKK